MTLDYSGREINTPAESWAGMNKTTPLDLYYAALRAQNDAATIYAQATGKIQSSGYSPDSNVASNIKTIMQPDGTYRVNPNYVPISNPYAQSNTGSIYDAAINARQEEQSRQFGNQYALVQQTPYSPISARSDVASNIQTIYNPATTRYEQNPNYVGAYNPMMDYSSPMPSQGGAFAIASSVQGAVNPNLETIARWQGYNGGFTSLLQQRDQQVAAIANKQSGGAAYDMAMEASKQGTAIDPFIYDKALKQGFEGSVRVGDRMMSRSTVPLRDYSSGMGGKNVPADYTPSGNDTYLPLSEYSQQLRTDTKIRFAPGGAFDVQQVVPSTMEGFTRIFPMVVAGGSDYALQSGMVSGKAQTPVVYDSYGLNAMWSADQQALVSDIQAHPDQYSRIGSELYGGVKPLTGKTLQGEFIKGNTVMPGRFARDSMNYANLVNFSDSNLEKQYTGADKLPTGASLTFATDPIFQIVNAKTGELTGVYPNFEPVKTTVIPVQEPPTILIRPEPVERVVIPAQFREYDTASGTYFDNRIVANPKYSSQFGGSLIGNPAWNATKELEENKQYNAMIGGMKEDVQRRIDNERQVWYDVQGWKEVPNPKYGQPVSQPNVQLPDQTSFMGMQITGISKAEPSYSGMVSLEPVQTVKMNLFDKLNTLTGGTAVREGWQSIPKEPLGISMSAVGFVASGKGIQEYALPERTAAFTETNRAAFETPRYGYTNTTTQYGGNETINNLLADIKSQEPYFTQKAGELTSQRSLLEQQNATISGLMSGNVSATNQWLRSPREYTELQGKLSDYKLGTESYNKQVQEYIGKNADYASKVDLYKQMSTQNPTYTLETSIANVEPGKTPQAAIESRDMFGIAKGGFAMETRAISDFTNLVKGGYSKVPEPLKYIGAGIVTESAAAYAGATPFILPALAIPAVVGGIGGAAVVYAAEQTNLLGLPTWIPGGTGSGAVKTAGAQFAETNFGKSMAGMVYGSEIPVQPRQYSEVLPYKAPSEISVRQQTIREMVQLPQYSEISPSKVGTMELQNYRLPTQGIVANKLVSDYASKLNEEYSNRKSNAATNADANIYGYNAGNPFGYQNPKENAIVDATAFLFTPLTPTITPNANPFVTEFPNPTMPGKGFPRIEIPKITIPVLPWGDLRAGGGGGGGGGGGLSGFGFTERLATKSARDILFGSSKQQIRAKPNKQRKHI